MKPSANKLHKLMIGVLYCAGLLFPFVLLAQKGEMPISTTSDEARKIFLEGRDRFELTEFATSAQYFERAIAKDPNFALAHIYRFRTGVGGAKIAQEYLAKAVGMVDKVSLGEKYLVSYYQALVEGQGPKRKEYLDKLLELFPADKRVQFLAGGYFNNVARDFATALKYYGRVTELDKTYAPVYNNIGYCHLSLGNFKEAEKAFVEQIKLAPKSPNPYDSYAELLMRMGRYDESIEQYKKAYDQDPSFTAALEGVGDDYVLKGEYKAAREYYQKLFDQAPDPGEKFAALDNIASSFVQEGNITEALQTYEKYRALAKEHSRSDEVIASYQNEGFILTETGNPAEGVRRY
ncbi:MAG: tetratricopeptide repeat protein, partial [Nitrososphaera sp.]|nr:tetratricopeptide repeat protein [Nitrososphaera sp.]